MAAFQNFRGAVGGFNREDVVRYIEYINNKHSSQINQLNTEMQALQEELAQLRGKADLSAQLEEANVRIAQLEQERDALAAQVEQMADRPQTENELEAYRRAERAERIAADRVAQLYTQANGALADATAKADDTATQVTELTDALMVQLQQLQTVLSSGGNSMRDAAAALFAIRPAATDEE
jgi:TolA-binding protein